MCVATFCDVPDQMVVPIRFPHRSGGYRGVLVAAVLISVVIGAIRSWPMVTEAARRISSLELGAIAVLAGAWVVLVAVRALVYRATHPELRFVHGVALDQINLAATNALPGGSIIGIAARFRMGRSLGLSPEASGLTIAASGQAFALGRWMVAVAVAVRFFVVGHASDADRIVLIAAGGAFALAFALWKVVTGTGRPSRAMVTVVHSVHERLARRSDRIGRIRFDETVARLRRGIGRIVRERGPVLLCTGVLSTVASAAVMVLVLSTLTYGAGPATWDIVRAYLFARVATSFVPTPGNAGVLDGALVAGIVATGVDPSVALASVVLYRAVTFVAPMVLGGALWLLWRRRNGMETDAVVTDLDPGPTVVPDPLAAAA